MSYSSGCSACVDVCALQHLRVYVFDFVRASGQTQGAYVEDENGYLSSQRAERERERARRSGEVAGGNVISKKEKMKKETVGNGGGGVSKKAVYEAGKSLIVGRERQRKGKKMTSSVTLA